MKHPGIIKQTPKQQGSAVLLMAKLHKGEEIKRRKKRAIETRDREQPERELRNAVIKELRRKGIKVMRVEPCFGKYNIGIPDLWTFNLYKGTAAWIELKSDKGVLKPHQKQFREDCLFCNTRHYVVRSVVEAVEAVV